MNEWGAKDSLRVFTPVKSHGPRAEPIFKLGSSLVEEETRPPGRNAL